MSDFTAQAYALAEQIQQTLVGLRSQNANFTTMLGEAQRLVAQASIKGLHMVHPSVVFQGEDGVAMRVMLMNGKPLPIATAWIPVPKNWMVGNRQ